MRISRRISQEHVQAGAAMDAAIKMVRIILGESQLARRRYHLPRSWRDHAPKCCL